VRERERDRVRYVNKKILFILQLCYSAILQRDRVRYVNKKILFILQLCYSAILHLESHCSTLAMFFCKTGCIFFLLFDAKIPQHIPFTLPNANTLTAQQWKNLL